MLVLCCTVGSRPSYLYDNVRVSTTLLVISWIHFLFRRDQVNQCLKEFEGGRWAQAQTWDGIIAKCNAYCVENHTHVVDISPMTTPPSSPKQQRKKHPNTTSVAAPRSDQVVVPASSVWLPRAPRPPVPTSPSRLPPLPPRLRAERAAARLEAAAQEAEAAAHQIAHYLKEAEVAARRVSAQAERSFGILQKASEEARRIGQEADRMIEVLAATGATMKGMFRSSCMDFRAWC